MLHYVHAWMPLLSVSLTAAVVFALAWLIIGGAEVYTWRDATPWP